jgi:hypothetical protein
MSFSTTKLSPGLSTRSTRPALAPRFFAISFLLLGKEPGLSGRYPSYPSVTGNTCSHLLHDRWIG